MLLMIDNYDSFTYNLVQYFGELGEDVRTFRNDEITLDEIATLIAYEATSELTLEPAPVETPLERTEGKRVSGKKLTLVPILRAGLGMVEGVARLVPAARVGHIGLYRDHDTLEPVDYYFKVPSDASERDFFLLDPMLATGGSATAAGFSNNTDMSVPAG